MIPADPRRLAGIRFGISISTAPDMPMGVDPEQATNHLIFRFASSLILEGGTLLLGHRWKPNGIMEHLALQARESRWRDRALAAGVPVPILNLLAWPDEPPTSTNGLRMMRERILEVRQIPPPGFPLHQLQDLEPQVRHEPLGEFLRARALTAMRQEMARLADVRLCLGGAMGRPLRRLPGVVEEALVTHQAGKPLLVAGAVGGTAKAVASALLHRRLTDDERAMFMTPPKAAALFAEFEVAYPVPPGDGASTEDGWNALRYFQEIELEDLARRSGLTLDEYVLVLTSNDVLRVLALAVTGILRLNAGVGTGVPRT